MSASTALNKGTILDGKYRIDGMLGAGGMGVVMSATHLDLDAPVAIKLLREEFAHDEELAERLMFEARAVARMRSAHVVRVLDVSRLGSGEPYIVLERLEGADLASILSDRGPLPVNEALGYLLQACDGLAEAHGLGIVHRDLKPENLYLAETPEGAVLKLLDFGISKNVGNSFRSARLSTNSGDTVGSPYYMSPEQMRASPTLDARADIWSLGAITFELLTGKCPFEAEGATEVCTKVLTAEPPSLRELCPLAPAQLEAIVRRCLQKNPNDRFQNVGELATALRELHQPDPRVSSGVRSKSLVPEELAALETSLRGKRRPKSALLALALMAAVAGVGYWQLRQRPLEAPAQAAVPAAVVPAAPPIAPAPVQVAPVATTVPEAKPEPAKAKPRWTAPASVPAHAVMPEPEPEPSAPTVAVVAPEPVPSPAPEASVEPAASAAPATEDGRYGL